MPERKLRRRRLIQAGATAAIAGQGLSCKRSQAPWRFLTVEEARTLEAVCEQIIPGDRDAGAKDAGVVNFIDRQLTLFHKPFQNSYRKGLAGVDESSRAMFQAAFIELDREQQLKVLEAMDKNKAPGETWKQAPAKSFFDLVVVHTMQAFYGNPRHGGNRDAVSWRMLGVPEPPVRGRLQYDFRQKG